VDSTLVVASTSLATTKEVSREVEALAREDLTREDSIRVAGTIRVAVEDSIKAVGQVLTRVVEVLVRVVLEDTTRAVEAATTRA